MPMPLGSSTGRRSPPGSTNQPRRRSRFRSLNLRHTARLFCYEKTGDVIEAKSPEVSKMSFIPHTLLEALLCDTPGDLPPPFPATSRVS